MVSLELDFLVLLKTLVIILTAIHFYLALLRIHVMILLAVLSLLLSDVTLLLAEIDHIGNIVSDLFFIVLILLASLFRIQMIQTLKVDTFIMDPNFTRFPFNIRP